MEFSWFRDCESVSKEVAPWWVVSGSIISRKRDTARALAVLLPAESDWAAPHASRQSDEPLLSRQNMKSGDTRHEVLKVLVRRTVH